MQHVIFLRDFAAEGPQTQLFPCYAPEQAGLRPCYNPSGRDARPLRSIIGCACANGNAFFWRDFAAESDTIQQIAALAAKVEAQHKLDEISEL